MMEQDRDACIYATIAEWQTAGDERTELELKPLAEAAFDAYSEAFNEAYDLELERNTARLIAEGAEFGSAQAEAERLAFEAAGEVAKRAAGDALDAPGDDSTV